MERAAEGLLYKEKPSMSNEASRSQVLCRTGLKGKGQSHRISYGAGDGLTKAAAIAAGKKWVKEQNVLQGL